MRKKFLNDSRHIHGYRIPRFRVRRAKQFNYLRHQAPAITQIPDKRAALVDVNDEITRQIQENDLAFQNFNLKSFHRWGTRAEQSINN